MQIYNVLRFICLSIVWFSKVVLVLSTSCTPTPQRKKKTIKTPMYSTMSHVFEIKIF